MAFTHTLYVVPSAHAIRGEAALTRAGLACALIPVPRTLTSACGVCLRVMVQDREVAEETLTAAGVEVSAVHDVEVANRGEKRR